MTTSAGQQKRYRTSVLFARDAPAAVLLLRHGKNHFHLIKWNTKNNTFTYGQWMRGDIRLSDLSPDGTKLLYFAAQRHVQRNRPQIQSPLYNDGSMREIYAHGIKQQRKKRRNRRIPRYMGGGGAKADPVHLPVELQDTWTALSTVPYFTALALWPAFGTWTGGGVFESTNKIALFEDAKSLTPHLGEALSKRFAIASAFDRSDSDDLPERCAFSPSDDQSSKATELRESLESQGLTRADWVYQVDAGKLLFSGDGKLFLLNGWNKFDQNQILDNAKLLADFTGQTFRQMKAPNEALKW